MSPEVALLADRLRVGAQEFLDRWYPGTGVTVDWTGDAYLVQVTRGLRLAPPIWVRHLCGSTGDRIALRRQLLTAAWELVARS
jgi:hypothetical protein